MQGDEVIFHFEGPSLHERRLARWHYCSDAGEQSSITLQIIHFLNSLSFWLKDDLQLSSTSESGAPEIYGVHDITQHVLLRWFESWLVHVRDHALN